ncbi:MAG: molybdopterin-dependent oxidoreductase [Deltaproteobacteria bacterium]|nr:molybdopterin-dependent oxidoreductase [Deltaproteobacteria bacterium]
MAAVSLTINGVRKRVDVSPETVLIDLLRNDLGLTGTKQSCDRKGQCGACTVIIDRKAVRSCLKRVIDLEGADVISIEGLGTPENPHLIQEAFVLSGAIQCGFCTPGMIMATKVLLDTNPKPTQDEIKKALARNLCRCTGYKKIVDAVSLAAEFIRNEKSPEKIRAGLGNRIIGVSHPRPSAMLKACGLAKFSADYYFDNALEIACAHAFQHHAKIKSIDCSEALKMPGVAGIITEKELAGTNRVREAVPDKPLLMEDKVRSYGDPVAIVAAETREQARAAAAAVRIEFEPLPVMMTPGEALAPGAPQLHGWSPNLLSTSRQVRGDASKALKGSRYVVEADFSTQVNHQAPLEPEVTIAYMDGKGDDAELVIIGRSINIHPNAQNIAETTGWKKVRYVEAYSGGQFGQKSAIITECLAAAACVHFRRPIRYVPSLEESIFLSPKRHPYEMKVKMGADKNGRFTAYTNDMYINKGAYFVLGGLTIGRTLHMLSSSYLIPNIWAECKLVYSNNAPGAAARGAGPPQSNFAMECAIDMLAEKAGIDALEFRRMNSLKPGEPRSTGDTLSQWEFPEICDMIKPHWERAKKDAAEFNKKGGKLRRGAGLGAHAFGIGSAGDMGSVAVEVNPDDSITVFGAIADPGEGNDAMLTQVAAYVLDIPMSKVRLETRSTHNTVGMGPAAGSRMTYIGGGSLQIAVEKLKKAMDEVGSKSYEGLKKAGKSLRYEGIKKLKDGKWDPETGQGESNESIVHNMQMAEVEVNTETGEVRVLKMTTAVDAGPIINPQAAEGQLEGGMDQGIGYALREEYIHGETKDWKTFKFPTIKEMPEMELLFQETPRPNGALGATGIGEMTMISTAPSITNAIYNACGVRINHLPATPDKIRKGMEALKS